VADRVQHTAAAELTHRLSEIADLVAQLAGQQFRLLASEVRQDARNTGEAALCFGGAAGMFAAGGVLSTLALVHLLHRATRLPLWTCYGIAAGLAGGTGVGLVAAGRAKAAAVQLPALPETAAGLKENLAWIREQLTMTPQ